jgi:hypothetical protein
VGCRKSHAAIRLPGASIRAAGRRGRKDAQAGRGSRRLSAAREQPITGLPSWTPDLALEDANLMAEKKYLRLQVGRGVAADKEDIEEQAEEAVDRGQEHDPASSQARPPFS